MSVERLSAQHQFQMMDDATSVPETSSYQDYLFTAIGHSCYFMFHAVFGIFIRVVALPFQSMILFDSIVTPFERDVRYCYPHSNCEESTNEFTTDLQRKLQDNIGEVARKVGLEKPVILSQDQGFSPFSMFAAHGTIFCSPNIAMRLSSQQCYLIQMLESSDHEHILDYLIAKELSHVVQQHELYQTLYDTAILITEVVSAILLGSIWPLLLIEGAASIGRLLINQKFEKDADLHAISALGTNVGAEDELLAEQKDRIAKLMNHNSTCFFRITMSSKGDFFIPNLVSANSLSTRLAYVRETQITST